MVRRIVIMVNNNINNDEDPQDGSPLKYHHLGG